VEEYDWDRLVEQLKRGECTPFLGAGACYTLPTAKVLSRELANHYGYPFPGLTNLSRVAQYAAILHDPLTVKKHVCNILAGCEHPNFTDGAEPHALLAKFPLPVYLTTNYDDFMISALREERGKNPSTAIYPWYKQFNPITDLPVIPSGSEPIVYHLHGRYTEPQSLVLTEEDYLAYLSNLAWDQGTDQGLIPPLILRHFAESPLLFIGYSLQDWTFRVLFHGLHLRSPEPERRRHVSVQLLSPRSKNPDALVQAQRYLDRHFEKWKITVFWGKARKFCTELRRRLR